MERRRKMIKSLYGFFVLALSLGALVSVPPVVSSALASTTIILDLDGVQVTQCYEPWQEDGVTLQFVETVYPDCTTGSCYFGLDAGEVWLYPARLSLDLTGLSCQVTSAEVDIIDWCGAGCTNAIFYKEAALLDVAENTVVASEETLVLSSASAPTTLTVSSCEGMALEIRLHCSDFVIDIEAFYGAGLLDLNYTVGTPEPVTWVNYLFLTYPYFQAIPLWTVSLPVIMPPMVFPISFPLPSIGWIILYSGLVSGSGLEAYDLAFVDTGWPED